MVSERQKSSLDSLCAQTLIKVSGVISYLGNYKVDSRMISVGKLQIRFLSAVAYLSV